MKQITSVVVLVVSIIFATNASANSIVSDAHVHSEPSNDKRVWMTIGSDAFHHIQQQKHSALNLHTSNFSVLSVNSKTHVVNLPSQQVLSLSEYMHDNFNRCGGFVFHDTEQQAIAYSMQVEATPLLSTNLAVDYTIDNAAEVNNLLDNLSSSQLNDTVTTLSNYYNRYYTQQSGVDAANWIKSNWEDIGQGRTDISVALFNHSWSQPSVIATIQGTSNASEIVVIGGHLDSINSSNPSSGRAPGADDNASGIAVITETLRAIVASGYKPARTIKLMGYAAEEVGLRGSKAIAQDFTSSGQNVVGVVQFDMTGNQGTANKDIVFMTDYTNSAQNDFLMQLIDTYLSDLDYGTSQCGYACSDHASWHNEGYPASMPFESNMGDANGRIHSTSDTVFDSTHAHKFARLSVTFLAELAKSEGDEPPPPGDNILQNNVAENGLSASQGSDIIYTMDVPAGATDIQFEISGGTGDADLYLKFGSAPTDSSYDCRPYKNGNAETCTGSNSGGTYYVRVKAYSTFTGLTLKGSYTDDGGGSGGDPINDTVNDISVSQGQWYYYSVDLAAGYSDLNVSITGGTGDADLYVRQSSQPTTSSYDCRPYKWGNEESCTINNPASTVWHIGVSGYSASSGLTLNVTATPQ